MENVNELWPELEWIQDASLREKTAKTWELALSKSLLKPEDLRKIPFTLLAGHDLKISFMDNKRAVVHIAHECGLKFRTFFKHE